MTRKEAAQILRVWRRNSDLKYNIAVLDKAIEALEQEPCEDCVSRQAVIEICQSRYLDHAEETYNLPAVTPKAKRAKWRHYEGQYSCQNCGSVFEDMSAFCPNCGADMREDGQE